MISIIKIENTDYDFAADLHRAGRKINQCLVSEMFKSHWLSRPYTHTDESPAEIWRKLQIDHQLILSGFSPPWYKFWMRNVRAYVTKKSSRKIHLNYKILQHSSIDSLAGTLAHEIAHLKGYGHGANRPGGSAYHNSVPHQFGSVVKHFIV